MRGSCTDFMPAPSKRTRTAEGFMVAPATIARAGNVQLYGRGELRFENGKTNDNELRVFRPREEVTSPKTLASFSRKTLTLGHPPGGVNAKNWLSVAHGEVGDAQAGGDDGNDITTVITARSQKAIDALESGKIFLSQGYDFDIEMTPGVHADGTAYDAVMKNIEGNHTAIVDGARGGYRCRVADHNHPGDTMSKVYARDGFSIEDLTPAQYSLVEAIVNAEVVRSTARATALDSANGELKTVKETLESERTAHVKAVADHATALAEVKKLVPTPETFRVAVADALAVLEDCRVLAPKLETKDLDAVGLRRALVKTLMAEDSIKPIAEAILTAGGEVDPDKAKDSVLAQVITTTKTLKKTGTTGDRRTAARDNALAGNNDAAGSGTGADAAAAPSGPSALFENMRGAFREPAKNGNA